MAIVKVWTDGELLTAATMNDLTGSTLMRFADAAARDAMLVGGLAPTPGMTVLMLDTGMTLTYVGPAGAGVWMPLPLSVCFTAYQQVSQGIPGNTYTALNAFTLAEHAASRNLYGWFDTATGKFNPKAPGIYELTGGVSMNTSVAGSGNTHRGGFRINGTGGTAYDLRSEHRLSLNTTGAVSFSLRKFVCQMNGTTDYAELVAYPALSTVTGTGVQAPMFSAKYLGQ
jgi:hypothetical protein